MCPTCRFSMSRARGWWAGTPNSIRCRSPSTFPTARSGASSPLRSTCSAPTCGRGQARWSSACRPRPVARSWPGRASVSRWPTTSWSSSVDLGANLSWCKPTTRPSGSPAIGQQLAISRIGPSSTALGHHVSPLVSALILLAEHSCSDVVVHTGCLAADLPAHRADPRRLGGGLARILCSVRDARPARGLRLERRQGN
jgi:hypothetical protein